MKRGYLSQYFSGVAVKALSSVETDASVSNQHEFNGSAELKQLFGDADQRDIPTKYLWIGSEQEQSEGVEGTMSWYDARRNHATRTEYRLYYKSNDVTNMMSEGDALFLAIRKDGSGLVVVTPSNGTIHSQLVWLFGLESSLQFNFNYKPVGGNSDAELDFAARSVLELLDIDPEEPESDLLDELTLHFGLEMPPPIVLSKMARQSIGSEAVRDSPDQTLLAWMERETQLFRRVERRILTERLERGFHGPDGVDVDSFRNFSLSFQNRRKVRAGLALESHISAILQAHQIDFAHGATTENRSKPDFLFPSSEAYHNAKFPSSLLTMLGAKSTLKDRWRQVLAEADRIEQKHLLTLQPAISEAQTDEMRARKLQLVVPLELHSTFRPAQAEWLMSLAEFLKLARSRQQ